MKVHSSNALQDVERPKMKKRFPDLVFKVARKYIENPKRIETLPRAPCGNAKVYLIDKPFLVLKKSKSHKNRIIKMERARVICRKNHYTHLIIPDARIAEPFIVERRLPIIYQNTKEQIGCYIEHRELFTKAVEQFTKFLCHTELEDIIWGMNPYQNLSNSPIGRYDNIALYTEENQGKLGLVDLERFRPTPPNFESLEREREWYLEQGKKAICLFPYHFEVIITVLKDSYPDMGIYLRELEEVKEDTINFFQSIYESHVQFVKRKNITLENPSEPIVVSVDRREELKRIMGSFVLPDKISLFQEVFPGILDLVTRFLSEKIERKVHRRAVKSLIELVSCRTLHFKDQDLLNKVVSLLKIESTWGHYNFAYFIVDHIFKQLVEGQEIAYYEPHFGFNTCVFC